MKPPLFIAAMIMSGLLVGGCSSTREHSYTVDYRQALDTYAGVAPVPQPSIEAFLQVYAGLTSADLPERVRKAYAPELYFCDTLNVIRDRDSLIHYLQETGKRLKSIDVDVLSVSHDGPDVYVRWQMTTHFHVMGKDVEATSIGISQLRFNADGKVVMHQDFWDSTEGLFSHLPGIGGAVRWVRSKT